jgi:hypothetical protein
LWCSCNQLKSMLRQLTCHCHYRGQNWCLCGAVAMLRYSSPVSCVSFLYLAAILVTYRQILYLSVMKGTRMCSVMSLHQCCVCAVACMYRNTARHLWQLTVV